MARNFGVPQQIHRQGRGSLWPVLLIVTILTGCIGAIDVAAHLRPW
jgi:hypothetical protein